MCGIAGIIDFSGNKTVERGELARMAAMLAHRGPDDMGIYIDSGGMCGLAHRRLSVIDPEGGHQPLSNCDESIWICYNGECYNFPELKKQLQDMRYIFRSHCDTEVVLHLYEEYGPDCVSYMRGMYGFAVWDSRKRQLFLARDRMGQKPLYYALHQGRFIFASECKAILQTDGFPRKPDTAVLGSFLLRYYVPADESAFVGIRQLPPGCFLTVTPDNYEHAEPQRYWRIPEEVSFRGSLQDAARQLRSELATAVKMRLISDVPLGAFLSGGLDSAVIVGLMSRQQARPVTTCSMGFDEQMYNELPLAGIVANRYKSDHYEFKVRPRCRDVIEKLSYYYDEPFADSSALPTYYLSHMARKHVTVALTGDGGDECFGGYDRYRALKISQRIRANRILYWLGRRKLWQRLPGGEYRSRLRNIKRFLSGLGLPVAERYLAWIALFNRDLLGEILQDRIKVPEDNFLAGFFSQKDATDLTGDLTVAQAMLADGREYLPGDINSKIDRASMSIGLELRCPFQDHKVVELAYSLPSAYRHNGRLSKIVLRQGCGDLVPAEIARQRKRGFGVPVGQWFRGPLRDMFIDTVLSRRACQRGYFRRSVLEGLLAEHDKRLDDHGHRFWGLLMLELWHRKYIDSLPQPVLDYAHQE